MTTLTPLLTNTRLGQDITNFLLEQRKEGKASETIRSRIQSLKQVSQTTDLNNSDEVRTYLANSKWCNKTKTKFIDTYSAYLRFKHIEWKQPKYLTESKMPFIPTETEIDLLISGTGKLISSVLQMLKETGMRIGELVQLKWIDIDEERKVVSITPEKGSNPRILPISQKLIGMMHRLPKKRQTIFQPRKNMLRDYLSTQRKALSEKLNNPRLKQITFHTLRHWKGTTEYHRTKDIIHVKTVLGHKSITSTLIYINLESALYLQTEENFTCKIAKTPEEIITLNEAGFTYIQTVEGMHFYKKRK